MTRDRISRGPSHLHDWALPAKKMLIAKAFDALPPGGFDYTGADCSGWMREAGFSATRVEHLAGPDSMVVGVK